MPLLTDDHRGTPAPSSRTARPSLTTDIAAPARAANGDAGNLRMLDELESVVRPGKRRSMASVSRWPLLIALSAVTLAGIWGWSHQRAATPSPSFAVTAERVLDVAPIADEPQIAASSSSTPILATVARIERLPEGLRMQRESSAELAELEIARGTRGEPRLASTAAQIAQTSITTTRAGRPASAASTHVSAKRARKPVPAAGLRPVAADSRSTARARPRARDISPPPRDAGGRPDADVVLLTALLDHVSNEGQGMLLASPNQVTLAQIVRRCESRSGKSPAQARECRQRICEGYWGKAEACPLRLAPEKKS